ncbi:MAG: DedA family protein [Alphaproteobacteria bacterium]
MNEIQQLAQEYGALFYVICFVWAFLEGETFLLFAGLAASQGLLDLHLLILSAWLGTACGDFGFFLLGRHAGGWLIEKWPKLKKGRDVVIGWMERHAVGFILTYRFIYGVRNISAVAIGMSHLTWQRYFLLNFCGAGIWAVSFASAGYLFGDIFAREENPVISIMIAVLLLFAAIMVVRYLLAQWKKRKSEKSGLPVE